MNLVRKFTADRLQKLEDDINDFVKESGAEILSIELKYMENKELSFHYALVLYKAK